MNFRILKLIIALSLFTTVSLWAQTEDENILREIKKMTYAGFETAERIVDTKLDFNHNWKFKLGENIGFENPEFDDSDWRVLSVPHDWSVEGKCEEDNPSGIRGGFYPMGKGHYRKTFVLDETAKGKRVKIRFDGVYMNSTVWLNGMMLGNYPYGFTTFEYDLSQYLNYDGKENVIAVEVDNSVQPNCRWYTGSGINRNVHLYITEQQHFQSFETFFRTVSLDENTAKVKVDCRVVSNNYPESERIKFQLLPTEPTYVKKDAKVEVSLKNATGEIVAKTSTEFRLRDYEEKDLNFEMTVQNPELWSDKTPTLYDLKLQLLVEGKVVNTENHKVGIRVIEFNNTQGMLVNGEKVIAKGVCLHKDAASFGTAVPKDVWRFRLEKLKRMGCNAIRTHGPVDPVFIEVCDELGFYMMSEAFDEWEKTWEFGLSESPSGKLPYTYHKYFNQWAETDLKAMIKRDRNHPAVFIYSIGNEVPEQRYTKGPETLVKLRDWAHETDDTRPTTVGCDWSLWGNQTGFMDSMDIAGYNYPDRYYPNLYEEQHEQYPDRILLGTENYITLKNWLALRDNEYVVGMFLWVGIDYLGESHRWPRRSWEWGLIDLATFEKSMYYYWQAFWSEEPMVHTAVLLKDVEPYKWRPYDMRSHWNFENKDMDTVFVFSNQPEVELFQNGKSLGRQKVDPDTYKGIYVVDFKKGKLESKAYNGKKVVATHTIETAGEAAQLGIKNQRENAKFNEDELLFLTAEVQDKKGIRTPYATNEITVSVEGGELIGLDSGDQFSHELFKQNVRKAHEGQLLLTVKPSGKGELKVRCSADGLQDGVFAVKIE
ncbi:glycoside hydrolase family 2 protein [Draconibacterium sediminis]|uniref:glycoside hydrolase family 2 protein n=1 Tax=Draconibacterium sediminis TaxID=1544798 RepID=UPI000AEB6C3B|nr:sugar-binding domain-containing protein [Draconibacterium sediminis]